MTDEQTEPREPALADWDRRQRIVVGMEGSGGAKTALRWALCEATITRCPFSLVSGWPCGT